MNDNDIRDRAYELWKQAGCPEGLDDRFWQQAQEQLQAETPQSESSSERTEELSTREPGVTEE